MSKRFTEPLKSALREKFRLALTLRVVLEALFDRHAELERHFEGGLERRRILVLLHRNNRLPSDTHSIGQILLRYLSLSPEFTYLIAYGGHQSALR